jgi:glycosyltransferase involved in cell wall biosynthesis
MKRPGPSRWSPGKDIVVRASDRPIRILELRTVWGTGGGPEKTILLGAAGADPSRFAVTVCYLRDVRDTVFEIGARAARLGVDYVEIGERGAVDPAVWPALRKIVRDRGIDLVHSHDYKTDLLAWALAKREGVVALSTAHAWTGHSRRERMFYYPVNKRLLAWFPYVVAVSGEIRQELIRCGARPERVEVILNGIDEQRFRRDPARRQAARARFGLRHDEVVLGSVGRLEPQKRFDLLMEAFARLRDTRPLRLLIAGEGSSRSELESKLRALGISARCSLVGHCSDVIEFHDALDLFVQSSAYEGTPNVVLEAMALETPVVATDVGGTAELARADVDGLIVPALDVAALSQAIEDALHRPWATAVRAASARRRVESDLSFSRRMAKVEAIYERLVRQGQRSAAGRVVGRHRHA